MRLVHISDLHFGAVESGRPDALRLAVGHLNPDLVVMSGDLSQRGTRAELEEGKAFLDSLPQPLLVVPGNHDIPHGHHLWARFKHPWNIYRQVVSEALEPEWRNEQVAVIGVNSVRPGGWYVDWSRGHVSRSQLRRIELWAAGLPAHLLRVMVVHHPPAAPPQGTRRHLIDKRRSLFTALNRAGIDLLMCGHFHMSYAMPLALPGMFGRSAVLSVTSTATSHRLQGEPNGFHVIEVKADWMEVQAWTWGDLGEGYVRSRGWRFARDENRNWRSLSGDR